MKKNTIIAIVLVPVVGLSIGIFGAEALLTGIASVFTSKMNTPTTSEPQVVEAAPDTVTAENSQTAPMDAAADSAAADQSWADPAIPVFKNTDMAREEFDKQLNSPELLTSAMATPEREGESITGFKIANIQPGSVIEQVGLQAGDVVKNINGTAINSIASAQGAYTTLRSANEIKVGIERAGQKQLITLRIQAGSTK